VQRVQWSLCELNTRIGLLNNELLRRVLLGMRTFDLDDLEIFRSVVREGSVTRAKGAPALRRAPDLNGKTLVAFPQGCSYRRRLIEWLAESGASPRRLLEFSSYHAIVACVAAGSGVAIVPADVLKYAALGAEVQRHPLSKRLRINRTHLVWPGEASPALPKPGSRKPATGE
jgi:DNA-binding transcriptional LysR family regulator